MKDIRLIKILKTFTKEELKSFRKFLNSSFCIPSRNTVPLFDYLTTFHPDYTSSKLSKEEIFKKLFGEEIYKDGKLQNLILDLTKSAEYFLAYSIYNEDELEGMLNLSKAYFNKNLYDESNRVNKLIEKKLQPSFSPDKDYIPKLKRLANLKYSYYTQSYNFENISECIKDLFGASVLQFIFDYINVVNEMKITGINYGREIKNEFIQKILDGIDFEKLIRLLEGSPYANSLYIGLHYLGYKTITDENNLSYYYLLKDLLFKNLSVLDRYEKWFFFVHLMNYSMQKEDNNIQGFKNEGLNIFKIMLENNAYSSSESQYMDFQIFRNIILSCNSQKEIEWFNYFVEKYTDSLHPDLRVDLKHYAYAHLYFLKNEFEKSLEYASKINEEFFFFKVDIKSILLKVYYELNYFEQAFHSIDAFKHFIRDNKEIIEDFKNIYRNFIRLYEELIKIKSGQSKKAVFLIKKNIEEEIDIASKFWLLRKAEELITKV
ncbi:MAG: hypothetical protein ABI840_06320 [bacterium]